MALALLTLSALPGCDKPDVGARCELAWNAENIPPPPTPSSVESGSHYFEAGNTACDDLICLVSHAETGSKYASCPEGKCGYCSKPCVSDRDCYSGETGLKCEQILLDPAFRALLEQRDPNLLRRYLGQIDGVSFCVVPST